MRRSLRGFRSICFSAAVTALLPASGRAALDIGRLAPGRVMYAPKTWAVDSFYEVRAPRAKDSASDRVGADFELERGQTERFGWEAGLITSRSPRSDVRLDRLALGLRGLALQAPFELALEGGWLPSVRNRGPEWELEAEALANLGGYWSAVGQYAIEVEPGSRFEHEIIAGPLLRFGLQGLSGLQLVYRPGGELSLQGVVGGAVGPRVFLGVQPRIGLSRRAPDAALMLELHALFGPYPFGAWGLR